MALDKEKKSSRLLASRRYTHDSYTDAQEAFTSVLDIQASEVYTQANSIPTSSLPFSGSSQDNQIYTVGDDNIVKYHYRQKLTKSTTNNEVWFFIKDYSADGLGAQVITGSQETNFISPKYALPTLSNTQTEHSSAPGYLVKLFKSTQSDVNNVTDSDVVSGNDYTFDYKTGVVQFSANTPTDSQYIYMTAYQYVGKTLDNTLMNQSENFISGSSTSTGSFGFLNVHGDAIIGGNLQFGDSSNDSINFSADISSSMMPDAPSAYDMGSSAKRWNVGNFTELDVTGKVSSSLSTATSSFAKLSVGTDAASARFHVEQDFGSGNIASLKIAKDNTGGELINSYRADQHIFALGNGTQGLKVNLDPNDATSYAVGIGTTTARQKLDIYGENGDDHAIQMQSGNDAPAIKMGTSGSNNAGSAFILLDPRLTAGSEIGDHDADNHGGGYNARTGSLEIRRTTGETIFDNHTAGDFIFRGTNTNQDDGRGLLVINHNDKAGVLQGATEVARELHTGGAIRVNFDGRTDNVNGSTVQSYIGPGYISIGGTRADFDGAEIFGNTRVKVKTGSPTTGNLFVEGNVQVSGSISARELIVNSTVTNMTQSFSSGSTIFGDTLDDTHQFTGSLFTTGSIISNGHGVISSSAMIASEISGAFTAVSKSFRDDNFIQSQSVTARLVNIEGGSIGGGSVSGTNSGDVSLLGSLDYLTISGQQITRNAIDLATDTTGLLPVSSLESANVRTFVSGAFTGTSSSFASRIASDSSSFATRIANVTTDTITAVATSTGLTGGGSSGDLTLSVDFTDSDFATSISGSLGTNAALIRSLTASGISGSFNTTSASLSSRISTDSSSFAERFNSGEGSAASIGNVENKSAGVFPLLFTTASQAGNGARSSGSLVQPSTDTTNFPRLSFQTSTLAGIQNVDATASYAKQASVKNVGDEDEYPLLMYSASYVNTSNHYSNGEFVQPQLTSKHKAPKFTISSQILYAKQISGSFIGKFSDTVLNDISGAFNQESASFSTRVTNTETTQSALISDFSQVQSVGRTDVPQFAGLNIDGTITANTYIVSSSVTHMTTSFSQGNTQFGDSQDDTHQFTGSLFSSGSVTAPSFIGVFRGALSSSAQIADDISGSFVAPSSSIDTTIKSVSSSLDNYITTTSASLQDRISVEHNNRIVFANTSKKLRNDQYTPAVVDHIDGSKAALQLQSPGSGTAMTLWVTGSANWFIRNGVGALTTPVSTNNFNNMIFGTTTGTPQPTSQNNLAVGHYSYGGNNPIRGIYNASFGNYALYEARSITHNTAIGYGTGQELLSGSFNTFVGLGAGGQLDGGGNLGAASKASSSYNTMIGAYAGYYYREDRDHLNESLITNSVNFRSGSKSVYVGYGARPGQENPKYETVIGPFTSGHGSYTSTIGTGSLYVSTDGDGDIYAGTFNGTAVTTTGNISGSSVSTGSFGRLEVSTGKVNGDFHITDDLVVTDDAQVGGVFSATGNTVLGNAQTDTHTFTGHITASGDISASGTIFASKFESAGDSNQVIDFNDNLNISGHITASGDVSGSSTSTGSFGRIDAVGNINLGDNIKFNLGSDDDGNIKHTGANLQIQETTGNIQLINYANDKDIVLSTDDGSGGTTPYITLDGSTTKVEIAKDTHFAGNVSSSVTSTGSFGRTEATSGSFDDVSISSMSVNSVTAVSHSLGLRLNNIETTTLTGITSSLGMKGGANFGPVTMSVNFNDVGFATRITGSFSQDSSSLANRATLTETTASNLVVASASFSTRVTDVKTRTTVLEGSGYAQGVGTGNSPQFSNLTIDGTIRAKEFIVSSSVTHMTQSFSSGSTVFGDTLDDTHQFTGSIFSSGSVTAPSFDGVFVGALSSSVQIAQDISGSLGTNASLIRSLTADEISGSLGTNATLIRSLTASGITGSFNETSASISTRLTQVETDIDDDMTFAGDSGGDLVIDFDSEKFTIAGGTNATTVGSGNTLTVNVDDAFLINNGDDTTTGQITAGGFNTAGHVTASGNITGSSTTTASLAHIQIPDDGQLSIGSANDLILYHDGSNSYIKDAGTGGLFYRGGTQTFQNAAGTKTMAVFNAANSVDLNFNNSTKFQTTNTGISITGNVVVSTHVTASGHISGSATSTGSFGRVEVADDANIVGDLSANKLTVNNIVLDNNTISTTGDLTLNPSGDDILVENNNIVGTGHIKDFTRISGSIVSTGSLGRLDMAGDLIPTAHNNSNLGSPDYRWANIYSADLQLSNENNHEGNEIDGTKGSWTIQEGEDDLYLLNRRNGKKYKFKLEEIT